MRAILAIAIFIFVCLVASTASYASTKGIKATWVPVQSIKQQSNITAYVQQLEEAGITDIFVDVWNNGVVYFQSQTMKNLFERSNNTGESIAIGPDYLTAFSTALISTPSVRLHAWFEYGLMAAYGSSSANAFAQLASELGWNIGVSDGYVWMDPRNDEVLAFLSGIMKDALDEVPQVASVQLDDHFALPSSFLWSTPEIVTNAALTILGALPKGKVSLSPSTLSYALNKYNVNWQYWYVIDIGFSTYYPQVYRTTAEAFSKELDYTLMELKSALGVAAGIRSNGEPMTQWGEIEQMLTKASNSSVGVSIWDSSSVATTYHEQFEKAWRG